jgi:hypothetical protein
MEASNLNPEDLSPFQQWQKEKYGYYIPEYGNVDPNVEIEIEKQK